MLRGRDFVLDLRTQRVRQRPVLEKTIGEMRSVLLAISRRHFLSRVAVKIDWLAVGQIGCLID